MNEPRYHPVLHWLAIATACATFPLIFMGGLVTSHQAGMSVPDWPNSYGYNMFLFPPNAWVGGIVYEHTHRLMGTVVGFLSIWLLASAYGPAARPGLRRWSGRGAGGFAAITFLSAGTLLLAGKPLDAPQWHGVVGFASLAAVLLVLWASRTPPPRRGVRQLAWAVFIAVLIQGALGGLRVVKINLDLAVIHGCFAQAFFCLTALVAVVTGKGWMRLSPSGGTPGESRGGGGKANAERNAPHPNPPPAYRERGQEGSRLFCLALLAVVVIYCQLVVGALMRHYGAGLAILDLPLAYGKVVPVLSDAELRQANVRRLAEASNSATGIVMDRVTRGQIWLHFAHRVGAVLVTAAVATLAVHILRRQRGVRGIYGLGFLLSGLIVTQLTLGVLTVLLRKPADITSWHVAVGALTLVTTFVVLVRSSRPGLALAARDALPVAPERPAPLHGRPAGLHSYPAS